jgi:hypothetical protein
MQRLFSVKEALTDPPTKIQIWAPWMLKFLWNYNNKLQSESMEKTDLEAVAVIDACYDSATSVRSIPKTGEYLYI